MGNLGAYQVMTTLAKRVGGPVVLAVVTAVGGYIALRPAEAGVKRAFRSLKRRGQPCVAKGSLFTVTADGEDDRDLSLRSGDEYRVLDCDGDAVLIEVIGGDDNPHMVSAEFLTSISDYPASR